MLIELDPVDRITTGAVGDSGFAATGAGSLGGGGATGGGGGGSGGGSVFAPGGFCVSVG